MIKEVYQLFQKELTIEFRNSFNLSASLLYVFSTVYIIYISFPNIPANVWNTIYWVIYIFISINALLKSFTKENSSQSLFYYQITHPNALYISKLIYNFILIFTLGIFSLFALSLVSKNPIEDFQLFILCTGLTGLGLSSVFTFLSAISSKGENSQILTAVLGFPIILPILLCTLKISASSLRLLTDTSVWKDILMLASIDVLIISLTLILFPYLWRE